MSIHPSVEFKQVARFHQPGKHNRVVQEVDAIRLWKSVAVAGVGSVREMPRELAADKEVAPTGQVVASHDGDLTPNPPSWQRSATISPCFWNQRPHTYMAYRNRLRASLRTGAGVNKAFQFKISFSPINRSFIG